IKWVPIDGNSLQEINEEKINEEKIKEDKIKEEEIKGEEIKIEEIKVEDEIKEKIIKKELKFFIATWEEDGIRTIKKESKRYIRSHTKSCVDLMKLSNSSDDIKK
ncbi:5798_t:CDS:1, partial [Gigaspora rosea]